MRAKRTFYNMSISLLYQLTAIACGLIAPRLILRTFGSTYNGVISSATHLLSMVSILNIGVTGATRVELYKPLANRDLKATSSIVEAARQHSRKMSLAVIAYTGILMFLYPRIFNSDLPAKESALLIFIVSIGTFAQYFFGFANQTLLKADLRNYVFESAQIVATIFNTICIVLLIRAGCSVFTVKFASMLVFAIPPIAISIYVRYHYHLLPHCKADKTALRNRGVVAFHSIAEIVHSNTDLIVLTIFFDAKTISVYSVYYLVLGKLKNLINALTNGIEGAFGNMWAKSEIDTVQRNFRLLEFAISVFAAIVFSCIAVLIVPFVAEYTRGVTDVNYIRYPLAALITCAETIFCIRQPYVTLVRAAGFYRETKKYALWEAAINAVASLVLVLIIGINGVVIGTLLANTFRTIAYIRYIYRDVLHCRIRDAVYRGIWLAATMTGIISVTSVLTALIQTTGWSGWILKAVVTFSASVIVTFVMAIAFYREDLRNSAAILKKTIIGRNTNEIQNDL